MNHPVAPLVVIGVGNVMLGDDAVGVRVVEALRAQAEAASGTVPSGTRLVDGGTLGLDLLDPVRESRALVLVDAVRLGGPAGEVRVLDGHAMGSAGGAADGGAGTPVGELLAVARLMGWLPTRVAMVAIEVGDLEAGVHLSPAVAGAIPAAVAAVRRELARMAFLLSNERQGGDPTRPMAEAMA